MEIFEKAPLDSQKAFMLGFMGHLAADTVAHNYFVPYKLIRSFNSKMMGHVYWEVKMDLSVPDIYWKMFKKFAETDYSDNDGLLEGHLKRTFFSFKTNKKIFNGLLMLQQMRQYRSTISTLAQNSGWQISSMDTQTYKTMAIDAMIDFFTHFEKSYVLKADPTGKSRMVYAREMIDGLREHTKNGILTPNQTGLLLTNIKDKMQNGIYQSIELPQIQISL